MGLHLWQHSIYSDILQTTRTQFTTKTIKIATTAFVRTTLKQNNTKKQEKKANKQKQKENTTTCFLEKCLFQTSHNMFRLLAVSLTLWNSEKVEQKQKQKKMKTNKKYCAPRSSFTAEEQAHRTYYEYSNNNNNAINFNPHSRHH